MSQFEFVDPEETIARNLREAGLDPDDARYQQFARLWREMQDLPRHLGQHSGGMVVCQGRLDEVVPLENASMPGRVVVQWDKDDCADLGIIKVDLLGLGMMAVLEEAIAIINAISQLERRTRARRDPASGRLELGASSQVDLAHLPPDDPAVYRMLQQADTIGVFQVESRAQMATLPRLQARAFLRHRRRGRDHPARADRRQHGASVSGAAARRSAGDLSASAARAGARRARWACRCFRSSCCGWRWSWPDSRGGEAEELRRAMGFKRSVKRMQQIETRLRDGMAAQRHHGRGGRRDRAVDHVVRAVRISRIARRQLRAASSTRARISRRTFPAAFYTALLNNQPMGFYHPATLVKDAQRRGVRFAPIDVQVSDWNCRVDAGRRRASGWD